MYGGHEYDYSIFETNYSLPLREVESKTKEQILLIATIHFAKNGYSSVTMRDIAKIAGIQQSSIYNHFESKEALWKDVIEHVKNLYMFYFDQLDKQIAGADSFEEVLELIFHEPKQMRNTFTCYAFSLIQTEQFRDRDAEAVFCEIFLNFSIDSIQGWFDRCIEKGMVAEFDTKTVAATIMHSTLIAIEISVHRQNKHPAFTLDDPGAMLANLQRFLLHAVTSKNSAKAV